MNRYYLIAGLVSILFLAACKEKSPDSVDHYRDRTLTQADLERMKGGPDNDITVKAKELAVDPQEYQQTLNSCVESFDKGEFDKLETLCDAKLIRKNPQAMYMLAMARLARDDNQVVRKKGRKLLNAAASEGYAEAQFELGLRYLNGVEMPRDGQRAQALFVKACDGAYGAACDMVGIAAMRAYAFDQADIFFDKAFELGSFLAPYYQGSIHEHGGGERKKNSREAIKLYKESAELGSRVAQYRLFYAYYKGDIVAKDFTKAQAWLYAYENDMENMQDRVWTYDIGVPANAGTIFKRIVARKDRDKGTKLGKSIKSRIDEQSLAFENAHRFMRPSLQDEPETSAEAEPTL